MWTLNFKLISVLVFSIASRAFAIAPYSFPEIAQAFEPRPTFKRFSVCSDVGCAVSSIRTVGLREHETARIRSLFTNVRSAQEERAAVAQALAFFELYVGAMKQVNTHGDLAGNLEAGKLHRLRSRQIDCIAESHTAASYLMVLRNEGLLRHHTVESIKQRGQIWFMTQHYAPRIRDLSTGVIWSVDTWFLHNAFPAFVIPYQDWQKEREGQYVDYTLSLCIRPEICTDFTTAQ